MTLARRKALLIDRRTLAHEAMVASINVRQTTNLGQVNPVCPYDVSTLLGVKVQFHEFSSMEGMYQRGRPPRIHVSALRPLPRKVYTCAHELGHHVFGHGSTVDELKQDDARSAPDSPNEILAEAFAAFLLMPTLGLRNAFNRRGWTLTSATPLQIFAIACEFGVGYSTLLTHLTYGIRELSQGREKILQRSSPKSIRAEVLGEITQTPLLFIDEHSKARTLDAEVGMRLLLPAGCQLAGDIAVFERNLPCGSLFRCTKPGISRATHPGSEWAAFVRVAREKYVGFAQYRHLEMEDDDEE